MVETTSLPLLIVDGLHGLANVPAVAPHVEAPRPAIAASVDAVLARLATWSVAFADGSAPATVKAVRSDWTQYLAWCEATHTTPLPASAAQLEAFLADGDRPRPQARHRRPLPLYGRPGPYGGRRAEPGPGSGLARDVEKADPPDADDRQPRPPPGR